MRRRSSSIKVSPVFSLLFSLDPTTSTLGCNNWKRTKQPSSQSMTEAEREVNLLGGQPCDHTSMTSSTKRSGHRRRKICSSADSLAGIDDECYSSDELNESPSVTEDGLDDRPVEALAEASHTTKPRVRQSTGPVSTAEEQSQLLVELIAREMAAAFLRQPSGSSLLSGSRSSDGTEDSSNHSGAAVGAIAELVVSSVRDGNINRVAELERTVQLIIQEQNQQRLNRDGGKPKQLTKPHLEDARSVPDGTLETEVSGSNSDVRAPTDTKGFDGSSSDEIVWTPEAVESKADRGETGKLEISLFPSAASAKPNAHSRKHEPFEPRIWTASDFTSKKRVGGDQLPPVMIDPDDDVEVGDYDADDLDLEAEDDDVSVMSDITGLTGAFDEAGKSKAKGTKVEVKAEENDLIKFSLADSDSFKAFEGGARMPLGNTTYGPISVRNLTIRKRETKPAAARPPPSPKTKTTVSFAHVQVRHYERIMNDNPASAAGPSIGIGWRFVEADPVCVDAFEKRKRRSRAQSLTDLQLSKATRLKLVRVLGYTDREIAANVRDLNRSRTNRKQTVDNLGVEKVEETVEKVKRKVRRLFSLQRQPSLSSMDSTKTPSVEADLVSV